MSVETPTGFHTFMTKTDRTKPHFWAKREIQENRFQDEIRLREREKQAQIEVVVKARQAREAAAVAMENAKREAKKKKRISRARTASGVPAGSLSYQSRRGGEATARKPRPVGAWRLKPKQRP